MKIDKWELLGYLFAIIQPVLPGILVGAALYTEKGHKEAGRNVILLSIVMTMLYFTIISIAAPRVP